MLIVGATGKRLMKSENSNLKLAYTEESVRKIDLRLRYEEHQSSEAKHCQTSKKFHPQNILYKTEQTEHNY